MLDDINARLNEQYQDIADAIETNGLGGALTGGYIKPDTDDARLNGAIRMILSGLDELEEIIKPYRI